ncbi:hypothetical protein LCGC14_1351470 [marine sediment metagenome]|uniref:Uncharacterized protein n=1 Tax=marine sediment metagenome TaxID=412755 RepID=A0A0F9KWW6_9ZZZZ
MANTDAAFGFRPVANDGGVFNGQSRLVYFPSAVTTAYIGDVVKLNSTAALGLTGAQAVETADTTDAAYGVVVSFLANPDNLSLQYKPTQTERYANIVLADNQLFEIQESANIGLAGVGFNAEFSTATGSTVTGYSNCELVSAGIANTAGLGLQVVGGVGRPDNDLTASNAVWLVKFNDTQSVQGRTGV